MVGEIVGVRSGQLSIPRILNLTIAGYEPYINAVSHGFTHEFVPGVNVIVGINGLGKTTLLNVVFRLLVGPFDPAKADRDRPGRKQSSLVRNGNFDLFRRRATDGAAAAEASATFEFGRRRISVTRSLYDLKLVGFVLDDHEVLASDDPVGRDKELMDELAKLMGFDVDAARARETDSYLYDYHFVIRHLVFFLEDKVPLIWNPDGQFVILRILLVDQDLSERISDARNKLLQADSQYRNRLWAANKIKTDLQARLADLPVLTMEAEEFNLAVSEVGALEQALRDLLEERRQHDAETNRLEDLLLRARSTVFEAQAALRREEAAFFHQAFRSVRSPGDLILQAFAEHDGCLVCGTEGEEPYRRARELLERHRCPVCETEMSGLSAGVLPMADAQAARLRAAEKEAERARRDAAALSQASIASAGLYRQVNDELLRVQRELEQARRRERSAELRAEYSAEVERLRTELASLDDEVEDLRQNLVGLVTHHSDLVSRSRAFIETRSQSIIAAFEIYAAAFMVEDCRLRFRTDRRARVAQSDEPIDWPAFEVALASGADAQVTGRADWSEVSESQKEFIDLAFRMALLRVATVGQASMLAIETPEASLDGYFVERAGGLLRSYAEAEPENVLLVTSNLTREHMISQLLGTDIGAEDVETRRRRTLNLLKLARPTKAYRLQTKFYDNLYAEDVGEKPDSADPEMVTA